jgi:hypothetical protein
MRGYRTLWCKPLSDVQLPAPVPVFRVVSAAGVLYGAVSVHLLGCFSGGLLSRFVWLLRTIGRRGMPSRVCFLGVSLTLCLHYRVMPRFVSFYSLSGAYGWCPRAY